MPVTGTASIVGSFGQRKHSEWNITTNSNGIDIQAQQGAAIRTVFEGEVSKVFCSRLQHLCDCTSRRHYTFYGNIYDLFVKPGDKLKAGDHLGRIFTDPDTGVPCIFNCGRKLPNWIRLLAETVIIIIE